MDDLNDATLRAIMKVAHRYTVSFEGALGGLRVSLATREDARNIRIGALLGTIEREPIVVAQAIERLAQALDVATNRTDRT